MTDVILTSKHCHKCNTDKPTLDFAKNKNRTDGLNGFCKACVNSYRIGNEEYRLKKIEAHKANKEHNNARTKSWRGNNQEYAKLYMEEWLKDNKPKKAASDKAWRIANKELIKIKYRPADLAKAAKRNASKLMAVPAWSNPKEIRLIYKQAQDIRKTGVLAEVDHIVPIRSKLVCGLHVIDNLQILTKEENLQKGNRWWPNMP